MAARLFLYGRSPQIHLRATAFLQKKPVFFEKDARKFLHIFKGNTIIVTVRGGVPAAKSWARRKSMNADLTIGTPWKVLLKYALPLFGGAVFQQLYTLADTIIAGRFAGQTALTAIGASNSIVNILMAFALGANAGCAVLAARYFGQKDNAKVKTTIYTALIAFAVFSAVLLVAGVLTCRVTLQALKTPGEAMEESVTYLNIYYYGLPSLMLYNLGTGIFSALGDSKTPFLFLVFSSVTNIVLDYYMVQPWGVAGVAWATFIAQGAACVLTLIFVFLRARKLQISADIRPAVFSRSFLKTLILLSLPVILQNSFVSIGNLFIQVRINELAEAQGIGITSGFAAGFKVIVFGVTCLCVYANGLTNYSSQNYGAHKFRRIKSGFYASLIISTLLAALFAVGFLLFSKPLISLFMSAEEDYTLALRSGIQYVTTIAPFYFIVNIKINADAVVRGCNGNLGFTVSTFSDLILRVVFVFVLTSFLGFAGVGWAWALGWSLGMVIGTCFYLFIPCLKKKNMLRYDEDGNLKPQFQPAAQ